MILHVLEALEGGTARHVRDLVTNVGGFEHHVAVPAHRIGGGVTDYDAVDAMRAAGATVHHIDMRRSPLHPANAAAVVRLRRLMAATGAGVVHGHSAVGGALARLASVGTARPTVYTPNGLHPSGAAMTVERRLGTLTDAFIAVSPSEAALAAANGLVPSPVIEVVPNGVDDPAVAPDLSAGSEPAPPDADLVFPPAPVIGFVGRLVDQKDPVLFVRMAEEVARGRPDVSFVLIGSGPLETELREIINRGGGAARIVLLGHRPNAARLMERFAGLVLPSRYEGCPYAALEAMSLGVPVVASNAVGNRDVIEDGVSGLSFRVGDAGEAAGAVERLLADPDQAARLGEAGRRRVRENFDLARMAGRTAAIYDRLIRAARPPRR